MAVLAARLIPVWMLPGAATLTVVASPLTEESLTAIAWSRSTVGTPLVVNAPLREKAVLPVNVASWPAADVPLTVMAVTEEAV